MGPQLQVDLRSLWEDHGPFLCTSIFFETRCGEDANAAGRPPWPAPSQTIRAMQTWRLSLRRTPAYKKNDGRVGRRPVTAQVPPFSWPLTPPSVTVSLTRPAIIDPVYEPNGPDQ